MDEDDCNGDYFSTFIIHQSTLTKVEDLDTREILIEDVAQRQKLKTRRKGKATILNNPGNQSGFKLVVKYGGYFKAINKGTKRKYCFGRQRTVYFDRETYGFAELIKEVRDLYPMLEDQNLLLFFLDKHATDQSFIQLEDDESFELMLSMYEEKKSIVFVTTEKIIALDDGATSKHVLQGLDIENDGHENYEEGSDYCHSEASYHSRCSDTENDDDKVETNFDYGWEFYSYDKDKPRMEVEAKFPDVITFRRALNHYAICNDFEYDLGKSDRTRVTATCLNHECSWRIHAAVAEDGVTFVVKTMQPKHDCCGINKRGNKHATQGWVADRVIDDLKKEGDIPTMHLQKSLETKFGISLPYNRVWAGKELAIEKIYGKWKDSFTPVGAFKDEILKSNPGSVVEFITEPEEGEKRHFQRFFVSLRGCISGFLKGCRPYISLDACHLKGKWKGVLAAATAIDGNNGMFPVAFAVMEGENENSWEWFLRAMYRAIEMPHGLVISVDMQKGLQNAFAKVYTIYVSGGYHIIELW